MKKTQILLSFILCGGFFSATPFLHADVSPQRAQELQHLLKHDCGSCHGMTLKGGLGPSLLINDLRSREPLYLQQIIREGVTGSAMPPWKALLSADDINFLVQQLLQPDGEVVP